MRFRFVVPRRAAFDRFRERSEKRIERAALVVSDKLARQARSAITQALPGRLGGVISAGSDLKKGRIKRRGNGSFSASGWVHIRNPRDERGVGALISATEGSDILPVKGRWLWLTGYDLKMRVGKKRMTPAEYYAAGMDKRIGPLEFIPGRHPREGLLIVRTVTVDRFGRAGSARRLPKRGRIGETRERRDFIVAFVGLRRVRQQKQVDVRKFLLSAQRAAPDLVAAHLRGSVTVS